MTAEIKRSVKLVEFGSNKMSKVKAEEVEVAKIYGDELATLKLNSKPLINSLTMMAEDFMKHAHIVVQTIEKQLLTVRPNIKLPILYLIDSIVKNVKRSYVGLFTQNIVSVFCTVFENVDDQTRSQMFKLRQTWNEVFPPNKLYKLDFKIHEIDSGWPVITKPIPSIHVNPKFLAKGTFVLPSPGATYEVMAVEPVDEATEAQMREQLLIKKKELLVLQQKKLELEYMQTKSRLEEQERMKKVQMGNERQQKLMKQAEMAKHQTDMATSIMALAGPSSSSINSLFPSSDKKSKLKEKFVGKSETNMGKLNNMKSEKGTRETKSRSKDPSDALTSSPEKKSRSKEKVDKSEIEKYSGKLNSVKSEKSPRETNSRSKEPAVAPHPSSEKKSRSKEKVSKSEIQKNPGKSSSGKSEKTTRETKNRTKEPTKDRESRKSKQEREKEQYSNRKSAVLSRNYRKRQEPGSVILDDENNGKMGNSTDPLQSGDIDLRFEGLRDVDLRQKEDKTDQPQAKKSRSSATLIDDLFGQEDVDLRQSSSSWSQVKKPSSSPISSTFSRHENGREGRDSPTSSGNFDDIKEILREGSTRPPPAISPATSVGSTRSSCDPLGRPLLFTRLPDDPEERKRSLDSRSSSIDPVEQFCNRYIDKPSMRVGGLTQSDLQFAISKSQQELDRGLLSMDQYNAVLKRLVQMNELHKIQQIRQTRGPNGPRNGQPTGPRPGNPMWHPRQNFGGPRGGPRFSGPGPMPHQWGPNQWNGGVPHRPSGPNPFMEAMPPRLDDFIPEANPAEIAKAERDVDSAIPLDKILRQIRFYGETAIVFLGIVGDEPREISFQKGCQKIVYVDKEALKCTTGVERIFYIDKVKHTIQIGAPKKELYINGQGYETCFGGPPISVQIGQQWHSFKLEGPPPQVEVGKTKRYDFVAGRTTLFLDSNPVPVYLDAKPQLIDFLGFPVIMKFTDDFHSVTLNGRPFPTEFGRPHPMSITLPNGCQHFLRFADVSPTTVEAMHMHVRQKHQVNSAEFPSGPMNDGHHAQPFRGRGFMRGRGQRGVPRQLGPGFITQLSRPETADRVLRNYKDVNSESPVERNPLDMLATILPHSPHARTSRNQENAYESDTSFREESEAQQVDSTTQKSNPDTATLPLSVEDLLNKLLMAGILHVTPKEEGVEGNAVAKVAMTTSSEESKSSEENPVADSTTFPPLETVDLSFKDNMKERRVKLVDQICTGTQCGSCGLRFAPDQTFRYTQHLDWHFRQNKNKREKEKGNSRKALSRKWYYDLSDWIQFEEIEDLEERAASMFETFLDGDMGGDDRSTGTILNPDSYTVLAVGHEGDLCPQCREEFETFYDEEAEEWRLRDAFMSPESEGDSKLYHPICHQDYIAALQESTMMEHDQFESEKPTGTSTDGQDDEDEVLILKEGKKDVVLMEIDVEDDDVNLNILRKRKESENDQMLKNNSDNESNVELGKNNTKEIENLPKTAFISSRSLLSPILINDDDGSNSNIPGIYSASENISGVFGFALGLDSNHSQQTTSAEELKCITYNSWQFDFPKIKTEPPEWQEVYEGQVIMSRDYQVTAGQDPENITLDDDSQQPRENLDNESFDIDLTADDEVSSTGVGSLVAEIDGNLEFKGDTLKPLVPPTKIRINISGLDAVSSSASPSRRGSPPLNPDENPTNSPSRLAADAQQLSVSGRSPISPEPDSISNLDEMKRLKPRLVGRKLVNCPPKMTGKEESGLCVIC